MTDENIKKIFLNLDFVKQVDVEVGNNIVIHINEKGLTDTRQTMLNRLKDHVQLSGRRVELTLKE